MAIKLPQLNTYMRNISENATCLVVGLAMGKLNMWIQSLYIICLTILQGRSQHIPCTVEKPNAQIYLQIEWSM